MTAMSVYFPTAFFDFPPSIDVFFYKYDASGPLDNKFDISSMLSSSFLARFIAFALLVLSCVSVGTSVEPTTTCTSTTDNDVEEVTVIYVEELCACGSVFQRTSTELTEELS